jgi:hypothetical protein
MERTIESSLDIAKQRARAEISSQVEEFLRRGGRIEVVEDTMANRPCDLFKGGAGHDLDVMPGIAD